MLEAAVFGAYFNVMINLKDITDEKFKLAVSRGWKRAPALEVGMRLDRMGDVAPGTPCGGAVGTRTPQCQDGD